MQESIGIQLADGALYPIFELGYVGTKRIVLSTAVDNQDAIDVEVYRGKISSSHNSSNRQMIGKVTLEDIPLSVRGTLDILCVFDIDADNLLSIEVSIDEMALKAGSTFDIGKRPSLVDVQEYKRSDNTGVEPQVTEEKIVGQPVDEDFVLGIDPQISYDKKDVRDAKRERIKVKIAKKLYIPVFLLYLICGIVGLCMLAFVIYLGIRITPLPPLQAF